MAQKDVEYFILSDRNFTEVQTWLTPGSATPLLYRNHLAQMMNNNFLISSHSYFIITQIVHTILSQDETPGAL